MKLLRLSSNEQTAIFDNVLNEDLIVAPNSKIALSNVSFTRSVPQLVVDDTTDTIIYNVGGGNRTANLSHNTYSATTDGGILLFQDVKANLNAQLRFLTGKEFGGEWDIGFRGGSITIEYDVYPFVWATATDTQRGNFSLQGAIGITGADGDAERRLSCSANTDLADDSARAMGTKPIPKGCSAFRTQLDTLTTNNSANNGFGLVFTESFPDDLDPSLSADQEKYSIRCVPDPANLAQFKYVFRDGSGNTQDATDGAGNVLRPVNANGGGDGDVINLDISQGSVNGRIYITNGGTTTQHLVFSVPYNQADLYPILINKSDHTILYNPKSHWEISNYEYDKGQKKLEGVISQDDQFSESLGIPVPPRERTANATLNLNGASRFAQFCGFDAINGQFSYSRPNYDKTATFASSGGFQLLQFDSYVIEFMSNHLESYDGRSFMTEPPFQAIGTGGRFSILKVIPNINKSAKDRSVNYEPSTLQFIDLSNNEPITLRNVKARILNTALEPITVEGVSVMTLLIKGKNEEI
jgi:hypothetical protein